MISFKNTPPQRAEIFGNDIVDLSEAASEGGKGDAFMSRVFAPEELIHIRTEEPARIWEFWACKEASYKAISSRKSDLPFAWSRFIVSSGTGGLNTVRFEEHLIACRTEVTDHYVHALGQGIWENGRSAPAEFGLYHRIKSIEEIMAAMNERDLKAIESDSNGASPPNREADIEDGLIGIDQPVYDSPGIAINDTILRCEDLQRYSEKNRESAAVRFYALREIASLTGLSLARLSVSAPTFRKAPVVYLDGREFINASFSHHGRFAAVAFTVP
jgi:phosphopantetheinyl transferase (holo-ACP synthase)